MVCAFDCDEMLGSFGSVISCIDLFSIRIPEVLCPLKKNNWSGGEVSDMSTAQIKCIWRGDRGYDTDILSDCSDFVISIGDKVQLIVYF